MLLSKINQFVESFLPRLIIAVLLVAALVPLQADASQLTGRSITLGSSAGDATTTHKFDFTIPASANLGSIKFTYCTTASGTCNAPSGLNVDGVTLDAQSGATGFTVDATPTTANVIAIKRTAAAASGAVSFTFGSAVNPTLSGNGTTFYVRVQTYQTNAYGTDQDSGTVAGAVTNQIQVTASVDETLNFCAFQTGSTCGAGSGTTVALGTLSSSSATSGTSKLVAGTNGTTGYVVQYTGATLTGNYSNTIAATGTTGATSSPGSAQFGINLVDNATPNVGTNPSGGSGSASTNYGTADTFSYVAGSLTQVASAAGPTADTLYTVSYLANIPSSQKADSYTTTITYICTATF